MLHQPRHCRRRPAPVSSVPPRVRGPRDALVVLAAVRALVPPGRIAALVLDPEWRPLEVCLCADDTDVEDRSRLLLDLYAGDAAGVVFASVGRDGRSTERDASRLARLADHGACCGVPVLDWFVLDGDVAHSLAPRAGVPWQWPVPDVGG